MCRCPEKERMGCFAIVVDRHKVDDCIDIDTCDASEKKHVRRSEKR